MPRVIKMEKPKYALARALQRYRIRYRNTGRLLNSNLPVTADEMLYEGRRLVEVLNEMGMRVVPFNPTPEMMDSVHNLAEYKHRYQDMLDCYYENGKRRL